MVDGKALFEVVEHIETWTAMEECYKAGLAKNIGVSNYSLSQLKALCEKATIKPHNLQVLLFVSKKKLPLKDQLNKFLVRMPYLLASNRIARILQKQQYRHDFIRYDGQPRKERSWIPRVIVQKF